MKKERINWEVLPLEARDPLMKKSLYYVPGVAVSDAKRIIFVSGQMSLRIDSQGDVINKGDIVDQTETAIERVKTVLEAGGATLDDVVQVNVFLRHVADREKHAEIRARYFKKEPPASTLVGVNLALEHMLIEINAIAVV